MVIIERQETISGGNFHGEYPAKALDYLAIGVHEIGAISERRIERLCNPGNRFVNVTMLSWLSESLLNFWVKLSAQEQHKM